jgi:hypothetical protein
VNRRDFFKVFGLGVAGLVAPQWTTERYDMNIGDILAKLGRREALTSDEQQRIRLWGNQTEFNNAYITGLQNGQGNINVNEIRANTGLFAYPPNGYAVRLNTGGETVSTGATGYTISWATKTYDDINMWNSAAPTIININITGKYIVTGRALWNAANLTGTRGYYVFNADTSEIILNDTVFPTTLAHRHLIYDELNLSRGTRLSVMAKQFSGVDATLTHAKLTIRLLKSYDSEAVNA